MPTGAVGRNKKISEKVWDQAGDQTDKSYKKPGKDASKEEKSKYYGTRMIISKNIQGKHGRSGWTKSQEKKHASISEAMFIEPTSITDKLFAVPASITEKMALDTTFELPTVAPVEIPKIAEHVSLSDRMFITPLSITDRMTTDDGSIAERMDKSALHMSDIMRGAGVGAGLGGLGGAVSGMPQDEEGKRHILRNALMGAGTGALGGGIAAHAFGQGDRMREHAGDQAMAAEAAPSQYEGSMAPGAAEVPAAAPAQEGGRPLNRQERRATQSMMRKEKVQPEEISQMSHEDPQSAAVMQDLLGKQGALELRDNPMLGVAAQFAQQQPSQMLPELNEMLTQMALQKAQEEMGQTNMINDPVEANNASLRRQIENIDLQLQLKSKQDELSQSQPMGELGGEMQQGMEPGMEQGMEPGMEEQMGAENMQGSVPAEAAPEEMMAEQGQAGMDPMQMQALADGQGDDYEGGELDETGVMHPESFARMIS